MVYSISVSVETNEITQEEDTNYVYSSNSLLFTFTSRLEAEIELSRTIRLIRKLFKFEIQWFIENQIISLNLLTKTAYLLPDEEEYKISKLFDYSLNLLRKHFRYRQSIDPNTSMKLQEI